MWSLDEAVERVTAATVDLDVGAARGVPWVLVELGGREPPEELDRLRSLAAVAVATGAPGGSPPSAFDLVVDDDPRPVLEAIERSPVAAIVLAQLLRLAETLPAQDALTAESLAFATLQAGPEFARWLERRGRRVRRPETTPTVRVDRSNGVTSITLDRPRLRNAVDAAMRNALVDALRVAEATGDRVELRGDGSAFCIGGDVAEFGSVADPAAAHAIRMAANPALWLARIGERVTANLHGPCVGAGVEMAAFAGQVVARPDTVISLPELSMGLVPGAGGTVSVPRRIGRHRFAHLVVTGERIDVERAHDWGLVDAVVE